MYAHVQCHVMGMLGPAMISHVGNVQGVGSKVTIDEITWYKPCDSCPTATSVPYKRIIKKCYDTI